MKQRWDLGKTYSLLLGFAVEGIRFKITREILKERQRRWWGDSGGRAMVLGRRWWTDGEEEGMDEKGMEFQGVK